MKYTLLTLTVLLMIQSHANAMAQAPVAVVKLGKITLKNLVSSDGYPLYVFKDDTPGVSNCSDACAQAWPPVTVKSAQEVPAPFSSILRKDGTIQLTDQENRPLYKFVQDKPGIAKGHGLHEFYLAEIIR